MHWFSRTGREQGWLAITLAGEGVRFAHGQFAPGGKSVVTRYGMSEPGPAADASRDKLLRELHATRYQCLTVLEADEYQLLLVEAPNVPQAELKSAIRWRVKDMVDYPVDDAAIDVLDIPPEEGATGQRTHNMYAVAARNEVIASRVRAFEVAKIPLAVIDIPEAAQRNIAALYEVEGRGLALLHFGRDYGLLTITYKGELYLARRIEIGFEAIRQARGEAREALFNRIVVELQRTFDHFERQFRLIAISGIVLGPQPEDTGLKASLVAGLAMNVQSADLSETIGFGRGAAPDLPMQWALFHVFGGALRYETKVL